MAEEKITSALEKELDLVERKCIRSLQLRAFRCSADCCEDKDTPHSSLQRCLEHCVGPVVEAERKLQGEINQIQDRLTRCAKQCEDEVKDMLAADPKGSDRAQQRGEACLMKCADTNIPLLSKMIARYRSSMNC